MAQTVLVTLTTAGVDSGPFSLYSDADGYAVPIVTGISRTTMLAGYLLTAPDLATTIKVQSTGVCTNFDLIPISLTSTSTTTSTTSTSTSSSTTTTSTTQDLVTITLYAKQAGITYNLDFHYSTDGGSTWNFIGAPFNTGTCDLITSFQVVKNSQLAVRIGSPTTLTITYPSNRDITTCPSFDNLTAVCTWGINTNMDRTFYHTVNVEDSGSCVQEWYQIENCFQSGQYFYTVSYNENTFNVGDRVLEGLDVYTVVNVLATDPDPLNPKKAVSAALNPITSAQLTGCPDIVNLIVEPYYDSFSSGDKVRAIWNSPAISGPELGFSGVVSRYSANGCSPIFFTDSANFNPGGTNAVAIDNTTYANQTSCLNLSGTSPANPSRIKITSLTIYTQATPFARDVNGCPTDFSAATEIVTATANNYSGTYRFNIYDPSSSDYIYFEITGSFFCLP